MRILHTSDWHIGHILYEYDRHEEHQHMLAQIGNIISESRPDLLLISGDIYHTSQPSAFVQKLLNDAMLKIRQSNPGMTIIMTAGNHDSASRHETHRSVWQSLDVHTIGAIDRLNPDSHIIEIPGKGFVVTVPYAYERNIPEGFVSNLVAKAVEASKGELPVVVSAHTAVAGCDMRGHDRSDELSVGGIDALPLDYFGTDYDYLALGHIHKSQNLSERARYSGSPLPVSFDEAYSHTVTLVDIPSHGAIPTIQTFELAPLRPLVTIPNCDEWEDWTTVAAELKKFDNGIPGSYIRLNVLTDPPLPPDAREQAARIAAEKGFRFCLLNPRRRMSVSAEEETEKLSFREFMDQSPLEIFHLFAAHTDTPLSEELEEMFKEAIREVQQDDNE